MIVPKRGDESLAAPLVYTPDDKEVVNALGVPPEQNVVCKCEKVTEAEVVAACRRGLPVDSTQAMRKRTRAGMGGCQGKPWNYGCECRVAQIVARENALQTTAVGRRPWSATSAFERRWLTPEDKAKLEKLAPPLTAAEEAKEFLEEQGIAAPEAKAVDESLVEKIRSALPKAVGKVFGNK